MAIQNRSTTLPEIWAKNAQTTIPTPPVAGITYRNQALNSTAIDKAWAYKEIVDSANFNQHAYLQDMLIKEAEQYGVMRWNNTTTYKEGGFCLAEDGNLYQATSDNQGKEPTANADVWEVYPDLSTYQLQSNLSQTIDTSTTKYPSNNAVKTELNNKVGKTGDETIAGNKTFTGLNIFQGSAKLKVKSERYDVNSFPSTINENIIGIRDKNNIDLGGLASYINNVGDICIYLQAQRKIDGATKYAQPLGVILSQDGNTRTTVNTPSTSDNSSQIANTSWVRQVSALADLSNVVFDGISRKYTKIGNLLVQWGGVEINAKSNLNVTLPQPYKNANYKVFPAVRSNSFDFSITGIYSGYAEDEQNITLRNGFANKDYFSWLTIGEGA